MTPAQTIHNVLTKHKIDTFEIEWSGNETYYLRTIKKLPLRLMVLLRANIPGKISIVWEPLKYVRIEERRKKEDMWHAAVLAMGRSSKDVS